MVINSSSEQAFVRADLINKTETKPYGYDYNSMLL